MSLKTSQKCMNGLKSRFCAVLGSQWGDEGKGKLIDTLAGDYDIVARFNGGSNAGHTIKVEDKKFFFHLVPSGILHKKLLNVVGNGCVVNPFGFMDELKQVEAHNIEWKNRLFISQNAHMTLKGHLQIEKLFEDKLNIGTTKKGIGTTYASKFLRFGIRFQDFMNPDIFEKQYKEFYDFCRQIFGIKEDCSEEFEKLVALRKVFKENNMIIDTTRFLHENKKEKRILAEGANGALLDIDHGTYPFVTSSNTTSGGICTGLGVPPRDIETVIGVAKAYTTRVGEGPFYSELKNEIGEYFQTKGKEFGVTTGRKRRCGWLDLEILKKSTLVNGYSSFLMTKLDILSGMKELMVRLEGGDFRKMEGWEEDISGIRKFQDLPKNAQDYVTFFEDYLDTPVSWIGVGPERDAIIKKI